MKPKRAKAANDTTKRHRLPICANPDARYRIFVSYSHENHGLVLKLVDIMRKNGLVPMWDRDFLYGQGFHEQIKNFIAYAHVFLPVLTPESDGRKWVHQEIGYAMALGIPVLPVAIFKNPGEMISQIHALKTDAQLSNMGKHLSREAIERLVRKHKERAEAPYHCAEFAEARARMMATHCDDVFDLGFTDIVRQKGGLSSFHIPRQAITHRIWQDRYRAKKSKHDAPNYRSLEHCRRQREERLALERHARRGGCRLIINPDLRYMELSQSAVRTRLECLLQFLESMPDTKCQVAFHARMNHDESVTILGDWFAAESVKARRGHGYLQTIFTRHAPSLLNRIESFDQEFHDLLAAKGWTSRNSRSRAIAEIQHRLNRLRPKVNTPPLAQA